MRMAVTIEIVKIVDALETFEGWQAFLNVETGEVEEVSNEMLSMAEETDGDEEPELSDDDQDEFDLATKIVSNPENFLSLPDEDDIHEWSIMEKFAESVKSGRIRGNYCARCTPGVPTGVSRTRSRAMISNPIGTSFETKPSSRSRSDGAKPTS